MIALYVLAMVVAVVLIYIFFEEATGEGFIALVLMFGIPSCLALFFFGLAGIWRAIQ